jgi:hypothetical protein
VEEAVMYAVPVLENVRVTPDVNYRVWLGQPYMSPHLPFWIDMFERARGMDHNQLAPLPMADDYTPPRENATEAERVNFLVERFQVLGPAMREETFGDAPTPEPATRQDPGASTSAAAASGAPDAIHAGVAVGARPRPFFPIKRFSDETKITDRVGHCGGYIGSAQAEERFGAYYAPLEYS